MKRQISKPWIVLIIILVFILVPIIVARITTVNVFKWMNSDNDWIGFWGGYLGGIFTLGGVILTITYSRREANKMQRLSIMPYLAIVDFHTLDNPPSDFKINLGVTPEEEAPENDYFYFFKTLVIKGCLRSIGNGHATNCLISDIQIENKKIKYSTIKQSIVIQNEATAFLIDFFDFGLRKEDISANFLRNLEEYFGNMTSFTQQPILKVSFNIYFEDVVGNKYKQHALYDIIISDNTTHSFDEEYCYYEEIKGPQLISTINRE